MIVSGRTMVVETRTELKWVFAMASLHFGRRNSLVIQSYPPRFNSLSARKKMHCAAGFAPPNPRSSHLHMKMESDVILPSECTHRKSVMSIPLAEGFSFNSFPIPRYCSSQSKTVIVASFRVAFFLLSRLPFGYPHLLLFPNPVCGLRKGFGPAVSQYFPICHWRSMGTT